MSACMNWERINVARRIATLLFVALFLAACKSPELPEIPDLPGLTEELRRIPDALRDLQLPDLSGVELPSLTSLPQLSAPEGALLLSGPTERRLQPGESLPGTRILFQGVDGDQAIFLQDDLRSPRRVGDALTFSGEWPGLSGSNYSVHYRVYRVGNNDVRVAGVHQLLVPSLAPQEGVAATGTVELRLPYTDAVLVGEQILGTTLGYLGKYERGAQLSGLPASVYPYRASGDSIVWEGALRPDVGARFNLRMLNYGADGARVGGIVTLRLPGG